MRYLAFVLIFLFSCPALHASAAGRVRDGNRSFKKGEYDRALDKYREAQISAPDNPAVHFNIGDALYKTGDFSRSDAEFQRALSDREAGVRSRAYYNLGNSAFRQQKYDEALTHYKKALDLDPGDLDAKYNVEYLLKLKSAPQQQKENTEKKDGDGEKDRQGQGAEKKDGQKDGKDKDGKGTEGRDDKARMSKEDARRILQYYNESDKSAAQKRKMALPQLPKVEEDW